MIPSTDRIDLTFEDLTPIELIQPPTKVVPLVPAGAFTTKLTKAGTGNFIQFFNTHGIIVTHDTDTHFVNTYIKIP